MTKTKSKISLIKLLTPKQWLIVLVVFAAVLGLFTYTFLWPNRIEGKPFVKIVIKKGQTLNQVIDTLYSKGIIPSKRNMKIAAYLLGAEKNIVAGRYEIPNSISYVNLVLLFKEGKCEQPVYVHLYEGITLRALGKVLNDKLLIDSSDVVRLATDQIFIDSLASEQQNNLSLTLNSLEGYLLPGDYYFYKDTSPNEVLRKLNAKFVSFFSENLKGSSVFPKYNFNQVITMASIIQGESKKSEEHKTIAGVYYNRLRLGMKLQADPTIQYALNGKWRRLLYSDLKIESPYNTYKHFGLPPGPINNPGQSAILAALNPEEHNYIFFVADGTGGHTFSENYGKHLLAIKDYKSKIETLVTKTN